MKKWCDLPAMLAAMTFSSACGGGGGGDSAAGASGAPPTAGSSPSAGSTPGAVAASGTLQASVPASTYGATAASSGFDTLNSLRQSAGAGLLAQSAALDVAANAHAKYLTTNAATGISHVEDASKADFYAATIADRMVKAGLTPGFFTEVIGGAGASMSGRECIAGLLNTVYHGVALLSQTTRVGIGFGLDGAGVPLCVADLASLSSDAYGQVPASGAFVAYPFSGQTGLSETFYAGYEIPRPPVSLLPNLTAGTPVIVNIRNADYVNFAAAASLRPTVTQFVLRDASGNVVPTAILANPLLAAGTGVSLNADANLAEGFVVMVPLSPLAKSESYAVSFAATLQNGGSMLSKTWTFFTNP